MIDTKVLSKAWIETVNSRAPWAEKEAAKSAFANAVSKNSIEWATARGIYDPKFRGEFDTWSGPGGSLYISALAWLYNNYNCVNPKIKWVNKMSVSASSLGIQRVLKVRAVTDANFFYPGPDDFVAFISSQIEM